MNSFILPPAFILIFGGLLLPWIAARFRPVLVIGLPLLTLLMVWLVTPEHSLTLHFLDYQLNILHLTATGRVFATVFSIMACVGGLYALKQANSMELSTAFIYAGAAIGVTFSADFLGLFIFWEIMAIASTLVLWSNVRENPRAYRASMRYLLVHLFGGVVLMAGIATHTTATDSIALTTLRADSIASVLILIGFLVNAGAPPFSSWIPDAYPEASPSGSVFLSAFTTKTAVFAILMVFPGEAILIYLGLFMVFYGIIYALLENDIRRILAYSIVNQIGFMLVAIGVGSELALNGATAHAFVHIIYKGLLMMAAGSVLLMTGKRKCTDLGGLFQSMPVSTFAAVIGGLAVLAAPFTSGFVTKSLETSAVAKGAPAIVWFLMMAAAAASVLHAGFKFQWFVFFDRDSGIRTTDPSWNMRLAMWIMAAACILIGVAPSLIYGILPYPVDYHPYSAEHIVTQIQLILFSAFAFFILLPLFRQTLSITLDFDWTYRKLLWLAIRWIKEHTPKFINPMMASIKAFGQRYFDHLFEAHGPQGFFARTWPSASMVLWVAILLATSMILYYVKL